MLITITTAQNEMPNIKEDNVMCTNTTGEQFAFNSSTKLPEKEIADYVKKNAI